MVHQIAFPNLTFAHYKNLCTLFVFVFNLRSNRILKQGPGRSIAIVVGGAAESLNAKPGELVNARHLFLSNSLFDSQSKFT